MIINLTVDDRISNGLGNLLYLYYDVHLALVKHLAQTIQTGQPTTQNTRIRMSLKSLMPVHAFTIIPNLPSSRMSRLDVRLLMLQRCQKVGTVSLTNLFLR